MVPALARNLAQRGYLSKLLLASRLSTTSSIKIQSVLPMMDRNSFEARDIVTEIWTTLGLPNSVLSHLLLPGAGLGLPSSFKVGPLAQATIGLSALSAANIYARRNQTEIPKIIVPLRHACAEFKSERLYILNGKRNEEPFGPLGGLHKTADGYVRIHDSFPNHRFGTLALLGLRKDATRQDVAEALKSWNSLELEEQAIKANIVIVALRSYKEWDLLPQAQALPDFPVQIRKTGSSPSSRLGPGASKCLQGLRVLELSRVIAAPLAGKTLAAHGADVLWVTSTNLPDLPECDRDMARGKRTIQLNLRNPSDKAKLLELAKEADVFIQGYRPGSLAGLGLAPETLHDINPNLIIANLSAYGTEGPWSRNRGFDSIVQTCSGMNVSEAEHFGNGSPARPTPCQALDHGGGYLLATAIMAALYRRMTEGGGYTVDVSLAGVMKYLRTLGQYEGKSGFKSEDFKTNEDAAEFMETRMSGFGELVAVRHSAQIAGVEIGWDIMPKPLGSDEAKWLS